MPSDNNKIILKITIVFFCCFSILFGVFWYSSNSNIEKIKKQNQEQFEKRFKKKDFKPFEINTIKLKNKNVLIDPSEIEKINKHITILAEEVNKESNRAESIIDKDLDRLNLFMATGIGFLTLIGIFVPLLINVLSFQDLKEKQRDIEDKIKTISPTIDGLKTKTNKLLPDVCNLMLQNSINRFYSVSPLVLYNSRRAKDFDAFVDLLTSIKTGFLECKGNEFHIIKEDGHFRNILDDFKLFLKTFRLQGVFVTKKENEKFDELILVLEVLKKSEPSIENVNYQATESILESIIVFFKDKKGKP